MNKNLKMNNNINIINNNKIKVYIKKFFFNKSIINLKNLKNYKKNKMKMKLLKNNYLVNKLIL